MPTIGQNDAKRETEKRSAAHSKSKAPRRREIATLYDAVAGRVGYEGFRAGSRSSNYRDTTSTSAIAVPPEEVLFRRKGAPSRYEEDDFYFVDRHLNSSQRLPDSDLLKAIHTYAADFYGSLNARHGSHEQDETDFRSLDETALLAVGILLEEAARETLGKNGELAFVEEDSDG